MDPRDPAVAAQAVGAPPEADRVVEVPVAAVSREVECPAVECPAEE